MTKYFLRGVTCCKDTQWVEVSSLKQARAIANAFAVVLPAYPPLDPPFSDIDLRGVPSVAWVSPDGDALVVLSVGTALDMRARWVPGDPVPIPKGVWLWLGLHPRE
jgi:hypothetical protein